MLETHEASRLTASPADTNTQPAAEAILGIADTITELLPHARQVRELLDALPAAIYITDAEGRLTFYNKAAVTFSGRTPELGTDRWCVSWRLYSPDGTPMRHDECPMAVTLKTGRAVRGVEAVAERPDGSRVSFMPYPTPLHDASGVLIGAVNMLVDITDRKRSEQDLRRLNESLEQRVEDRTRQVTQTFDQLRESERRFRMLVDGVIDYAIFMLDRDGIVTNWNSGAERIKGYRADEIVGQHFSRFYTPEDRASGVPARALATAMREGRYEAEGWRLRKNGERFWASVVIDAVYDAGEIRGFAKVTRDSSERKRVEQALVDSERKARQIVDTALDGFVQIDNTGVICDWNAQAEKMFGWSRREAIGKAFDELLLSTEASASHKRALEQFLRSGKEVTRGRRFQLHGRHRDGRKVPIELAITAFCLGNIYVFNGFIRDLTEKIAAEAQLRQAQKMEAIGQLTGGIAHDFNNLLAAIVPSLELARSLVQDQRVLKYLNNAARAADRGADLTRQLLSFARKQDLVIKPVDANQLILEICEMLPRTLGPTTAIATNLEEGAWSALTDTGQLDLAILNLAINARDAMMPSGGTLTISSLNVPAPIAQDLWHLDYQDYVMISVADTGVGMSESVRSRVFEPFFTTKEAGQGSGLGLSMVYGFAQQSGGNVVLESELGQGTTVRIFLPRAQQASDGHDVAVEPSVLDAGPPSRILVVDDDDTVREVTTSVVRGFGHVVVDTPSGPAALNILRKDRSFDLVIADLAMPHLDGIAFAKLARVIAPGIPVLFVTGFAERFFLSEAAGVHLVRKPFRAPQLAEKLRELLTIKHGARAPVA